MKAADHPGISNRQRADDLPPADEASDEVAVAMLALPMMASNPTLTWRDAVAILNARGQLPVPS